MSKKKTAQSYRGASSDEENSESDRVLSEYKPVVKKMHSLFLNMESPEDV